MVEHTQAFAMLQSGLMRADSLLALYELVRKAGLDTGKGGAAARSADILRAAVVLLHGSQEEYIRGVLRCSMVERGSADAWKKIPLANLDGRAEKFGIDKLLEFRDQAVNNVLEESLRQALDKASFNSYTEIVGRFKAIDVSLGSLKRVS